MTDPPSTAALVSVVIPAYNHERFVGETLDSVLQNDHPRIELLVIDDGSKDSTRAVVQDWLTHNGHRFERAELRSRPNAGICATLNELVGWSTGSYVCIVASDDALLPGGISSRVEFLAAHPQYDAVVSDAQLMDETSATIADSALRAHGYRRWLRGDRRLTNLFLTSWTSPFQNQFFRADWLRQNPYPTGLGFEDLHTALTLSHRGRLGLLAVPTIRYRVAVGRTAGRLPVEVVRASNVATIEAALGDVRWRPTVLLAGSLARRKARLQGRSDAVTWLLRLSMFPVALRYRKAVPLLRSQLGRP